MFGPTDLNRAGVEEKKLYITYRDLLPMRSALQGVALPCMGHTGFGLWLDGP